MMTTYDLVREQESGSSVETLNAITDQKDKILSLINTAEDEANLEEAHFLLLFVEQVWTSVGYGYKVKEVRNHLHDTAVRLAGVEIDFLATLRKNDRVRGITETTIRKLQALYNACK